MLGKFGKTLRILGFDTLIASPSLTDSEILNQCLRENRYLVTNDRKFHDRFPNKVNADGNSAKSLLLDSSLKQVDQLRIFFDFFGIDISIFDLDHPEAFQSRCTNCNGLLQEIEKKNVKEKINKGTFENQSKFWICLSCDNVYWIGSHWSNIKNNLQELFNK